MPHHEVFSRFWRYSGEVPAGYQVDFLGTLISDKFDAGLQGVSPYPDGTTVQNVSYPQLDEEYFEWIDLLESVVAASGSYTMIELGAGYGRWALRAAFAAQRYNPDLRCHIIAVEAEPTVYGWLKEHFAHNGLKPRWHTLLHKPLAGIPQPSLDSLDASTLRDVHFQHRGEDLEFFEAGTQQGVKRR